MKKITLILLSIALFSCKGKDFKYKIKGNVMVNHKSYTYVPNEPTGFSKYIHPAIAYTDTIYGMNKDSIWYYNSNGSKLTLLAPYTIDTLK